MSKTYYDILGVSKQASSEEIERVCLALGAEYRAKGMSGDSELADKFAEVERAYETLSDKERRAEYDEGIECLNASPFPPNIGRNWVASALLDSKRLFLIAGVIATAGASIWGYGAISANSARNALREKGIEFTQLDFMLHATEPEFVKLFLKGGMSPNVMDKAGKTAFLLSTSSPESARLMIDAGADVNTQSTTGETALSLIVAGCLQSDNLTPLASMERLKEKNMEETLPLVRLLLESGADPAGGTWRGFTIPEMLNHGFVTSGSAEVFSLIADAIKKKKSNTATAPANAEVSLIEQNCSVNGAGMATCTFRNLGPRAGSKCVQLKISPVTSFETAVGEPAICSGQVPAADVRQMQQFVQFRKANNESLGQTPLDICDKWPRYCTFSVEEVK